MTRNHQGFTLLELITTIGIVGVLASMAVPAFQTQQKNAKLVSINNALVGAYGIARSEAINRGLQTEVVRVGNEIVVREVVSAIELNRFGPDIDNITFTGFATVTYDASGFRPFTDNSTVNLMFCDDRDKGREITISASGSTSVDESPTC